MLRDLTRTREGGGGTNSCRLSPHANLAFVNILSSITLAVRSTFRVKSRVLGARSRIHRPSIWIVQVRYGVKFGAVHLTAFSFSFLAQEFNSATKILKNLQTQQKFKVSPQTRGGRALIFSGSWTITHYVNRRVTLRVFSLEDKGAFK